MKTFQFLLILAALGMFSAAPVQASHAVYLDFSDIDEFIVDASGNTVEFPWDKINGNDTTQADVDAIIQLIIKNMVEDYATFDIHFSTSEPATGRYTKVKFLPILKRSSGTTYFGKAGSGCDDCTGIGSWDRDWASDATRRKSHCEVYAGSFESRSQWQGSNATIARIATGMSHTASHEMGHILDLKHCHSADDFAASGSSCSDGYASSSDQNKNWHVMASAGSTGLAAEEYASRNRYFSIHSSRRVLYNNLQVRNHWAPLGDFDGQVPDDYKSTNPDRRGSDLVFGPVNSMIGGPGDDWIFRLTTGSQFRTKSRVAQDVVFPDGEGIYLTNYLFGRIVFDGIPRMVYGRIEGSNTVRWRAHGTLPQSFGGQRSGAPVSAEWAADAGDAGDIFRVADLDGDGVEDLVYARVETPATVKWFVRPSDGFSFGSETTWSTDAGDDKDLFLLGNLVTTGAGADLVAVDRHSSSGTLEVSVYESTASGFSFVRTDTFTVAAQPDYVMLADVDFDADDDLVLGFVKGDFQVDWSVIPSSNCGAASCFGAMTSWATNVGDAGDIFRLADLDGDDGPLVSPRQLRFDLLSGRNSGLARRTSAPSLNGLYSWRGSLSDSVSFGTETLWGNAGGEGHVFP
jgi:hypothetical protein